MRKILQSIVLTVCSTLSSLFPLAASAQPTPSRMVICSSLSSKATFNLDGKAEALDAKQCRTYSGRYTYLFYTEYGRNPRYSLERVLSGGKRYDFQKKPSGDLDVVEVKIIPR
ncbi:MAG: hypothetical protein ACK5YH_11200 [Pseudanabaena sp.]|jgi:hypothetical protein